MDKLIALVEDNDTVRANYQELLESAGFVVTAHATKASALAAFAARLPDLALLDVTLGHERDAGFEICAELRRRSNTVPIIFLSGHDGEIDKISGMRLGADDYVTKDVSFEHLLVRIEALFRRISAHSGRYPALSAAEEAKPSLHFDAGASTVSWGGRPVDLTLTQVWIVQALHQHPGKALSHDQLMRAAQIVVEPNTVAAHVKSIRDRFRQLDPQFDCIRTERGRGYRWVHAS
jgi:two-component system, OmpR family, response regulator